MAICKIHMVDDLLNITLDDGTAMCFTSDHLVWVEPLQAYRRIDELTNDDLIGVIGSCERSRRKIDDSKK